MEQVRNYESYVGNVCAVDVAVRRLRKKLEDDPADPPISSSPAAARAISFSADTYRFHAVTDSIGMYRLAFAMVLKGD
jgi:Response regulators consisting of a CheY-like receiver domain and a winged-helix DNA-binding domain